jgi:hypothetical protein
LRTETYTITPFGNLGRVHPAIHVCADGVRITIPGDVLPPGKYAQVTFRQWERVDIEFFVIPPTPAESERGDM